VIKYSTFNLKMLCNDSYNNPSQTNAINDLVGQAYSIKERFKMGGIGSPKMEIVSSSATIHSLLVLDHNTNYSTIATHHDMLRKKLEDPHNGLQGFTELVELFNEANGTQVPYKTMNGYVKRHFGASVKIARKSHVKKDPEKVAAFKKTSSGTARS